MGLVSRLRLDFDDSHVTLSPSVLEAHPATRLAKILEAIETGNDVVALTLCEEYDVAARETKYPKGFVDGFGSGTEAKVRFRQKLCPTSVAVFNYFVSGELHIPQEVSFNEFRKALIFWDIDEEEISDCCLAHFNAEKSRRIVLEDELRHGEPYVRKSFRAPWTTTLGVFYGFVSFLVVSFLFFFSFMGFEYMVEPEAHKSAICNRYHGVVPQCASTTSVKSVVGLLTAWCVAEWFICLYLYLFRSTGSFIILVMDLVVLIPYVILWIISFVMPTDASAFMIDFSKHLLGFHGFIFLKLCRYFPVIQRLLFTTIKFMKEVIQLLLLNYILSAILAFVSFHTEHMFAPASSLFKSIFDAFWYSIVTLTTLGYGDYYQTEQFFAMLTMFLIVFPAILIQTLALIVLVRIVSETLRSGLT